MDEAAITQYITETFDRAELLTGGGATFFFFDPDRTLPVGNHYFATLVTTDDFDSASNLSRPGVYRLNIGVSKATFESLFGPARRFPAPDGTGGDVTGYDYSVLDEVLPHPVYGRLFWVCVLNPGEKSLPRVRELLAEAYDLAVKKHAKLTNRPKPARKAAPKV